MKNIIHQGISRLYESMIIKKNRFNVDIILLALKINQLYSGTQQRILYSD